MEYTKCTDPNCPDCHGTGAIWCPEENHHEPCVVEVTSDDEARAEGIAEAYDGLDD